MNVLVERLSPNAVHIEHLKSLYATLLNGRPRIRRVRLGNGAVDLIDGSTQGPQVEVDAHFAHIRVGPSLRLILAGTSPVATACAEFARMLGFEVILCDPREEALAQVEVPGIEQHATLPSLFIAAGGCHAATAVVALTHDPRIDDLAMIEAVRTPAFYIGVMGSKQTSAKRAERLKRSGGLSDTEIERLHMPIGLALGSKTPAEIALAVLADILRVRRGVPRDTL